MEGGNWLLFRVLFPEKSWTVDRTPTRKGNDNLPFFNFAPEMRAMILVTSP